MCLDSYWVIVPCWIAISSSLFIPMILNSNPFLCDEVFYLILFAAASILYVKQSKEIFLQNVQLVKTENQAVSLQSNAMMLETRMNDMRLLLGNIAHDLKTPVSVIDCVYPLNISATVFKKPLIFAISYFINLFLQMQAFAMELSSLDEAIVLMRGGYVAIHSCDSGDIADKGRRSVEIENCATSVVTLHDICSFMNATINRCLDYGKATVGLALFPLIEPVHLEESMNWVVNCINRTQEGNVSVVLAELLPAMCSHVNTDKKWLEENLLCLVSNAVKFQMHGLVHVRCLLIENDDPGRASGYSHKSSGGPEWASDDVSSYSNEVGALKSQLFLKFEVEDGGIGISAEKKDMLFNPYVDDRNVVGGTGLGLFSLSKRVEALGGECGVDAKQNGEQGCCFWFTIPYLPAESIPARSRASSSASSFMSKLSPLSEVKPISPRHNKYIKSNRIHIEGMLSVDDDDDYVHYDEEQGMILHEKPTSKTSLPLSKKLAEILLVEDSIIIQKTTKRTFEAWGYEVNIAANGLLGLNEIMKKKYDLVLMDLQMPVMDGMDATRKIREHEAEKQIPESDRQLIIGISANCDDATRDLALACGMNDFVPKPFSIEDLKRVLVLNKVPVN
jgi:signal transduction histidine kinase/CheY-like chemotaxis protein